MSDTADRIHRHIYGKSGRASANAGNPVFLAGFEDGINSQEGSTASEDDITAEFKRRGEPTKTTDPHGLTIFKEWKRGYHAARLQRVFAKTPANPQP